VKANTLEMVVFSLQSCKELIARENNMEAIFKPYVLYNVENWKFFHDDAQIIRFLNNFQEFAQYQINWQGEVDHDPKVMEI
jgi:hypothetical protein